MTDIFRIGDAEFAFASGTALVVEKDGLRFTLEGASVPYNAEFHLGVFDPENGRASPVFRFGEVPLFDDGDHRDIVCEDGGGDGLSLWLDGFLHGFLFWGRVRIDPGSIRMEGTLRQDYHDEQDGIPVLVARRFAPVKVVARPAIHRSVEAALRAGPDRVRHLELRGLASFPRAILDLANLETLSFHQCVLTDIPDGIGALTRLRKLSFLEGTVETLPAAIGDLAALETLWLSDCRLQHLPDGIGRLAGLSELGITSNPIEAVPDTIAALQALETLDLAFNRLRSLPAGLGRLPALTTLKLKGNRFEALPPDLDLVKGLDLEAKAKALYKPVAYRPDIAATWDEEAFLAAGEAGLAVRLRETCDRHGLSRYADALLRSSRRTVAFHTSVPDEGDLRGRTRFGGAPDLPPGMDYPMTNGEHWVFLAQIDLADIAPLQDYLPRSGLLAFFAEDLEYVATTLVLLIDGPADGLVPYVYPDDPRFSDFNMGNEPFRAFQAEATLTVSVPNLYGAADRLSAEEAILLEIDASDEESAAYEGLRDDLVGRRHGERPHLVNAHVFSQHENPEEQAAEKTDSLAEDWINLLMLDSEHDTGFCFWDAGTLTFSIHKKDLACRDFSRVRASIESS